MPQLQGGHVSHKTFSKSTLSVCRCRGGTCPTKRSLRAPLQCVPVKSKKSKFNCKLANGSHQSRCIQYQDVQCAHGSNNIKIKLKISTTMQYKLNIENTEKRNIDKPAQSSCSSCRQRRTSCSSFYSSPLPSSRTSSGKGR